MTLRFEQRTFAYQVMQFGLTNTLATFQCLMCHVFREFLRRFLEVYVENLYVHSRQWDDHSPQLREIFEKYCLYQICLNPYKCVFMVRQGKILGHIISKNGISTYQDKIQVILQLPRPTNAREVQGFIGHCGYYRRSIFRFASIARPLYALIVIYVWMNECEEYFALLKEALTNAPILTAPYQTKVFNVHVEAL